MVYNDENDDIMDDSNLDNTEKNTLFHNIAFYFLDMLNTSNHVKKSVTFLKIISVLAVLGVGTCIFFHVTMKEVSADVIKVRYVEKTQLFQGFKQEATVRYTLDKTFDIDKKVVERTLNIVTTYEPLQKQTKVSLFVFQHNTNIATNYDYPMFALVVVILLYTTGVYFYAHMK